MEKNLLILGGGRCVFDDYFKAKEFFKTYEIMAINDMIGQFRLEKIHHGFCLHKRLLQANKVLREEKGMGGDYTSHGITACPGVDRVWSKAYRTGESGTSSILVALHLGYTKIIVCGVPLDNSGHYWDPDVKFEPTKPQWSVFNAKGQMGLANEVIKRNPLAKDRVRSMSGRTADAFGKPDQEWADGNNK